MQQLGHGIQRIRAELARSLRSKKSHLWLSVLWWSSWRRSRLKSRATRASRLSPLRSVLVRLGEKGFQDFEIPAMRLGKLDGLVDRRARRSSAGSDRTLRRADQDARWIPAASRRRNDDPDRQRGRQVGRRAARGPTRSHSAPQRVRTPRGQRRRPALLRIGTLQTREPGGPFKARRILSRRRRRCAAIYHVRATGEPIVRLPKSLELPSSATVRRWGRHPDSNLPRTDSNSGRSYNT